MDRPAERIKVAGRRRAGHCIEVKVRVNCGCPPGRKTWSLWRCGF